MKKAGAATILVAFVLAVGLASVGQLEAADGKALFESKKCNLCHSIRVSGHHEEVRENEGCGAIGRRQLSRERGLAEEVYDPGS